MFYSITYFYGIYNFGAASVADSGRQWAQQAEKGGGGAARRGVAGGPD